MKHHLPSTARAFEGLLHQMRDEHLPVALVLDLWSLGHSAGDIARRVGLTSKRVSKIVAQSRAIGDKRAVLHCGANGRLLGRPGRDGTTIRRGAKTVRRKEVVMTVPKNTRQFCKRGHERTAPGECKACKRLTDALRYRAIKGLP